jgi:CxxC motif-containing protein
METKQLVCVNCPKGCNITVTLDNGKVVDIKGYTCDKGKNYAAQETVRPMRVLTSTVKVEGAALRVLPVITDKEIPLDLCEKAMEEIRQLDVKAPIKVNDVIVADFLGTGANLVASRSMKA